MSKFKKIYRDFFKLNEQDNSIPKITDQDVENAEKYAAAPLEYTLLKVDLDMPLDL